jgi:hypothetical protein
VALGQTQQGLGCWAWWVGKTLGRFQAPGSWNLQEQSQVGRAQAGRGARRVAG